MVLNWIEDISTRAKSTTYFTGITSTTTFAGAGAFACLVAILGYSGFKAFQGQRPRDAKTAAAALRELPMPSRGYLPYVGHLLSLGPIPGQQLTKWRESCGPIFRIKLGTKIWVVINDPKIAHDVFVTHGVSTSARPANTYAFRVYSMGGKTRRAVQAILSPKVVDDCQDLVEEEANALLARLHNAQPEGISVYQTIELMTLNVVLKTIFAIRAASTDDPLYKEIHGYISETITYSNPVNDMPSYLPIFGFIEKFGIEQQKKARGYRLNTIRCALFKRLIQQAHDLMVAGTDTTAVTITWMLVILVNHPDIQALLQAQVDAFKAAHDGRLPTFSERQAIPLLISFQKECMRFRPNSHFGVPHMAERDVDFHGYLIPKGAILVANLHAIHMNPEIYPNAEQFVVDRFLESTETMFAASNGRFEKRDTFNFGWGRRVCPGSYLAESEMFAALVRILDHFTLEPPLNENQQPIYPDLHSYVLTGVVVQPAQHNIRFVPRQRRSVSKQ
ncbi:cytochrome P450 [Dichotomocladium elegans]|nr:cytochrome P450 [Dichotomocladium elegans]